MKYFDHQQKIIDERPLKTGLFLGTGSGKTMLGWTLAEGPALVIAPKTQVEDGNWEREREKLGFKIPFQVISKETFRRDHATVAPCRTLIIDEAHSVCGATPMTFQRKGVRYPKTSQLFAAVMAYIERVQPERIYLCTATPDRSPMAIWAAAKILGKEWDFYAFREKFYAQVRMGRNDIWIARNTPEAKSELGRLIRKLGYVGRLEDWFDVPEQTFKTERLRLTPEQVKEIKKLRLEYPDPGQFSGRAHQVENGHLIGDEYLPTKRFDCPKVDRILEYAEEFPRMLVFARYTVQIAMISEALRKAGRKVVTLEGSTKDKGAIIAEANASESCVVVAQSSIAEGYELPDYPIVIFASLDGSIVSLTQGQGRVQRLGKLKKNLYVYLVAMGWPGKGDEDPYISRDWNRYRANVIDKVDYHEQMYAGRET